jgi:hypothetical protein
MARTLIDSRDMACRYSFSFAGAICDLTTNSGVLGNLLEGISPVAEGASGPHFAMEVTVDEESDCVPGRPHFRGMHHAAMASFGAGNVFVFDLLRKHVGGQVSSSVARDPEFWQKKVLPLTIGMMGACIGILPMHAACASIGGNGLLVAGASGAGKSTLSVALSQTGFDYVSDDWTYMNIGNGRLSAHGTSAPVKLLPDAARHFQGLANECVGESMNGELAYEVDAARVFGASIRQQCEPRWVVFLERVRSDGSEFTALKAESSRIYLESSVERLPEQLTEATERRATIIDRVSALQCWRFRYGGSPQYAALRLREFVESRIKGIE